MTFATRIFVTIALLCLAPQAAYACIDEGASWHFYCDPPAKRSTPPSEAPAPTPSPHKPELTATEQLALISEEIAELRAEAILNPTKANIVAYITRQNEEVQRASTFADEWKFALWNTPEIDRNTTHPFATLATRALRDERDTKKSDLIRDLNSRYGIFYFYRGADCVQCEVTDQTIQTLATVFELTIDPITVDGVRSPAFPNSKRDNGHSARLGLDPQYVPAVYLFDSRTKTPVPIAHGAVTLDTVMERIYLLVTTPPNGAY